jgi:hypothetical protein
MSDQVADVLTMTAQALGQEAVTRLRRIEARHLAGDEGPLVQAVADAIFFARYCSLYVNGSPEEQASCLRDARAAVRTVRKHTAPRIGPQDTGPVATPEPRGRTGLAGDAPMPG